MGVLREAAVAPWAGLVALTVVYAAGCRFGHLLPRGALPATGGCTAVLLAGVFLLPPPAAALVPVPGTLLGPGGRHSRAWWARAAWRAARLAAACGAAAACFRLLTDGAPAAEVGLGAALPAAGAAVLVCCTVCYAARRAVHRAPSGGAALARAGLATALHGVLALLAALLWGGPEPYGPLCALLVLVPAHLARGGRDRPAREASAQRTTVCALVEAVGLKDSYTRGHLERVGEAAAVIGTELGLDARGVAALRAAGELHDVGKLGVPTAVLCKEGPLTESEWRIIRRHPEHGDAIVRGMCLPAEVRQAVLHHHERFDGAGYPAGLAGGRIPRAARAVAVADAFDAMTSTRSYRLARPVEEALTELRRCAGSQFDPVMVEALVRGLDRCGWRYPVQHEPVR